MVMVQVFRELIKITKQLFGTENMFAYKSTIANQLFLLYCISGKIYFTDKLHSAFRCFWFLYHLFGLVAGVTVVVAFFLYDTKKEILMQLYVLSSFANTIFLGFVFPILVYHHREPIERMISTFDAIFHTKSASDLRQCTKSLKRVVLWYFAGIFGFGILYVSACIIDVIAFYDDAKVRNYAYYILPFPGIEHKGSIRLFLSSYFISMVAFSTQLVDGVAAHCFLILWSSTCHYQHLYISRKLTTETKTIDESMEQTWTPSERIDQVMRFVLTEAIRDFQQISVAVEQIKGFYEIVSSMALPLALINDIAQLYAAVSTDSPYAVKVKGIGLLLVCAWVALFLCFIAQMLENSITTVSFSVYSVPWYCSLAVRKQVYQFLHQTQRDVNLNILKVYPMLFSTFSRFAQIVLSSVNFLHQVTTKRNSF